MAYICNNPESYKGKTIGSGQCVEFVKLAAHAPATSSWKKGSKVRGLTSLKAGTAIATFNKTGKYASLPTGNHAAIYVSQDAKGLVVWDQYTGQPVHERPIKFNNGVGSASNDGDAFSVIE